MLSNAFRIIKSIKESKTNENIYRDLSKYKHSCAGIAYKCGFPGNYIPSSNCDSSHNVSVKLTVTSERNQCFCLPA